MSAIFGKTPPFYENSDFVEKLNLPPLIIHPSTSSLANDLLVDPEAYQQNYNGIYDESGDYVPQYCDNPDDIPQSMADTLVANKETANPAIVGETSETLSNTSDKVD